MSSSINAPWAPFPGPACGIKLNLIRACMPCSVASVMSTLCDPSGYTLPGSSVHVVLQVRILEWVAIFPSRGSSQPRDWTQISCIAGRFFTTERKRCNIALQKKLSPWGLRPSTSPAPSPPSRACDLGQAAWPHCVSVCRTTRQDQPQLAPQWSMLVLHKY